MTDSESLKIEMQALALLNETGIDKIPVPVDKIAKHLKAQLKYSPLDQELSGMVYIKNDVPIIGINALHHPHRQRFSLAHEIAHLCLHREHITNNVHVDKGFKEPVLYRNEVSAQGTDRLEMEANRFAAALLMPQKDMMEMMAEESADIIDGEPQLEKWAKKFKVSKQTLEYRIKNLPLKQMGEANGDSIL